MDSQSQFIASAMAIAIIKLIKINLEKILMIFGVQKKDKHLPFWGSMRNISEKFGNM